MVEPLLGSVRGHLAMAEATLQARHLRKLRDELMVVNYTWISVRTHGKTRDVYDDAPKVFEALRALNARLEQGIGSLRENETRQLIRNAIIEIDEWKIKRLMLPSVFCNDC